MRALSALVRRFAACLDAGDATGAASLFTEDAVLVVPEPPRSLDPTVERIGRAGVRATVEAQDYADHRVHVVVGEDYEAGATARLAHGHVSGTAQHLVDRGRGRVDISWQERWADDYRRTPEGWRFTRRALAIHDVRQDRS